MQTSNELARPSDAELQSLDLFTYSAVVVIQNITSPLGVIGCRRARRTWFPTEGKLMQTYNADRCATARQTGLEQNHRFVVL